MCSCGCNTCDTPKVLKLNETIEKNNLLSEGLRYHIAKQRPITDNIYRYGSQKYFELFTEARHLYVRGLLEVTGTDLEILAETDLGEYGTYEGKQVPLDFIMEEEDPIDTVTLDIPLFLRTLEYAKEDAKTDMDLHDLVEKAVRMSKESKTLSMKDYNNLVEAITKILTEGSEKKKTPELNKPKRGGSKKFYVYVRDPRTKNIKKVSFGDTTGLKAKINDPKARKAFAERHNCKDKKDKTKAGYWACRLPRYSKLLGMNSTYSGYW
jgi:hypothetical protein